MKPFVTELEALDDSTESNEFGDCMENLVPGNDYNLSHMMDH